MRFGYICLALLPILALAVNAELQQDDDDAFYAAVEAKKPKAEHHAAPAPAPHHSAPAPAPHRSAPAPHHSAPAPAPHRSAPAPHHSAPAPHHSAPAPKKPASPKKPAEPKKPSTPTKQHTHPKPSDPKKPHDPTKPKVPSPHRKPDHAHPKTPTRKPHTLTKKNDPKDPKTHHKTKNDPKDKDPTKKDHTKPDAKHVRAKKHCTEKIIKDRKTCAGKKDCVVIDMTSCMRRVLRHMAEKEAKQHTNPAKSHPSPNVPAPRPAPAPRPQPAPAPAPAPAPHRGGHSSPHRRGGNGNNNGNSHNNPAPPPAPAPSGPSNGKTNDEGIELIKSFEGFVPNFYNDATGIKTIGYGHACHAHPCDQLHPPLTIEQGTQLLKEDVAGFEQCVYRFAPELNSNQFSALVSFVYNLGCGALTDYDIGQAIKAKNYPEAARLFGTFVKAGGQVLAGLVRRREAERVLFCKSGGC